MDFHCLFSVIKNVAGGGGGGGGGAAPPAEPEADEEFLAALSVCRDTTSAKGFPLGFQATPVV